MSEENRTKTGKESLEPSYATVLNRSLYYKCILCKRTKLRIEPNKPKGKCENCQKIKELTPEEEKWMVKMKEEIENHTLNYHRKRDNPTEGWDYKTDKDYWGRRMKIHELSDFGKKRNVWVLDDIHMYGG